MNQAQKTEHFDVLVVGAGISGVGAAYHLKEQCPDQSFLVLEGLESFGGTWLMHRYPGIRSDSDLYTFGYRFKPWTGPPIATAGEILNYMGEVIEEQDLAQHIRYHHHITSANWSSKDKTWTLEGIRKDTGDEVQFTAGFLWMCQGYYEHAKGYTPEWQGMDDFKGEIVHPQTWPEDLDYKDKHVIMIGSGATTATVAPAIAADCSHVTILQRSPTYFVPGRNEHELADHLRELDIKEEWIHEIVRREILHLQSEFTRRAFEEPEVVKQELLEGVRAYLGPDYDVDKHFTPRYRPWRQRIAFVPDGDIFEGIKAGKASMVTDEIEKFTEKGILTKSGQELQADII
ncbi:MAG TPA: NAD(P)/FAD-dependent oxidoreductase, partial [Pseudomonadales bacterium]|nr:NAD(P)/FAD-dependent oxidoreductase [Pseudomonadales bacterium]